MDKFFGAEQIIPLLDKVKLKTLKPGRPRKRLKVLATDKGYDSKEKRAILRKARRGDTPHGRLYASVVFDLKYQKEFGKIGKTRADQLRLPLRTISTRTLLCAG
ncbi:MAG: hypothetical protein AAFW70_21555 [Cyanobacteria bacterium J06635_10]